MWQQKKQCKKPPIKSCRCTFSKFSHQTSEWGKSDLCDNHGTGVGARYAGLLELLISWFFFTHNSLWWERSEENYQTDLNWQEAEKHLRIHKSSKLEVDGIQQWMATLCFTPVSQEQEFEAIMGTDLSKPDWQKDLIIFYR